MTLEEYNLLTRSNVSADYYNRFIRPSYEETREKGESAYAFCARQMLAEGYEYITLHADVLDALLNPATSVTV